MLHDPIRIADTRAWLTKAQRDLGAGRADMTVEPPYPEDAMFHAQQGVEKALKGFLTWHETPFRKTHDLRELFEACCEIDPSLISLGERGETLTPYASIFRYPGEQGEPTREEAEAALSLSREVCEAIISLLPEETRP